MRRLLPVALGLAVLLLAGCTSDEPVGTEASAGGSSPTGEGPVTAEQDTGTPTEAPGTGDTDDRSDAAGAPGVGTAYCRLLRTDFESLFTRLTGRRSVNRALALVERVADAAPPEVAEEWAVLQRSTTTLRRVLLDAAALERRAAAGEVSREERGRRTAALLGRMQELDTPGNRAAGEAISAHAGEFCGVLRRP